MKLKYEMIFQHLGDAWVGVPVGEAAVECDVMLSLNDVGHDIMELLVTDTTPDAIVDAMLEQYDAERATVSHYVCETLDLLRSRNLIEE